MVLPILGVIGTVGLVAALGIAVSHLVHPASILFAVVVSVFSYRQFEDRRLFNVAGGVVDNVLYMGVAAVIGFAAYRAFAWLLLGVGSITAIVVIGVLFLGGVPLLVALLKGVVEAAVEA